MPMAAETTLPSEGVEIHNRLFPSDETIPGEIFAMQSIYPDYDDYINDHPIFTFKAASDPNTMYYHEAMKMPDRTQFVEATEKEMEHHYDKNNFELIHHSQIPKDATILPMVWQLR